MGQQGRGARHTQLTPAHSRPSKKPGWMWEPQGRGRVRKALQGEGSPGRGSSKDRGQRSQVAECGDRRFDGKGTGKAGRGRAAELSLPHPHLWN